MKIQLVKMFNINHHDYFVFYSNDDLSFYCYIFESNDDFIIQ